MSEAAIISVAITGSMTTKEHNPAVPLSVEEQVESTHEAFEAGAAVVHIHVRDEQGRPSSDPERFARVQEGIRRHCPGIIVQFSTGGRSGEGRARGGHLLHKPDMASLATGSVNFATIIYENQPALIDYLAQEMLTHGVKPEIEIFDLAMLYNAARMVGEGKLRPPLHVQFVMGIKNALPAKQRVLDFCVEELEAECPGATWAAAGLGRHQAVVARWSLAKGGHPRTGLEDNVRLSREVLAPSNAALVRQVVELCHEAGRRPATPAEARRLLGLPPNPSLSLLPPTLPGGSR